MADRWKALLITLALVTPGAVVSGAPPALGADPVPVVDDFDRPDSTALGTAASGQAWTQHSGAFTIAGGTAAGSGGYGLASVDGGLLNAAVSVTVTAPGEEQWLVVRLQSGRDYWRFGRAGGGTYRLQLVAADEVSTPGVQSVATVPAAAGDRLECRTGQTLTCYVNGRQVARTADPSFAAATRHGIATWQGSTVRFDDFAAQPAPQSPDVSVSLRAPGQVPAGGVVEASAVVENSGVGAATGVSAIFTVPSDLTAVSASTSAGSCSTTPTEVRCPLGDLPAGAAVTATLTGTTPVRDGTLTLGVAAVQTSIDVSSSDDAAEAVLLLRTDLDPGTVVADGFARPDDPTGLGTSETDHTWTTLSGNPTVRAGAASTGEGYGLAAVDSGVSTGTVSARATVLGQEFWLIARLSSAGDYWRFGRSNGGEYQLQLVQGNALRSPALDVRAKVVPSSGDLLSCRMTDSAMTCSVGDVVVVRTTDATGRTATRHGLAGYSSPEARLDAFAVVAPALRPDLRTSLSVSRLLPSGLETTAVASVLNGGAMTARSTEVLVTVPAGSLVSPEQAHGCAVADATVLCHLGDLAAGQNASVKVRFQAPTAPGPVTTTASARSVTPDDDTTDDTAHPGSLVYDSSQPPPLAYDSFSRPDATTPGVTETGQPWHVHSGALSLTAGSAALGDGYSLATFDVGTGNGVVSARLLRPGTEFWTVLRFSGPADYWRFGRSAGGPYQLQLVKGNALAAPAVEAVATVNPAAGDRLECRAGSGLTCSVNGVAVVRTLDPTFAAATAHGLAAWLSSDVRWDDVSVTDLPPVADVATSLTGTRSVVVSGALAYSATVANVGTAAAESTTLSGLLPAGTTDVVVTPSSGSCSRSDNAFACSFGQLAAGVSRTVEIRATAPAAAGPTSTTVTAGAGSTDAESNNDTTTLSTTVRHPTPPGTVVHDAFDRPDGALGTSATGQTWTVHSGGFGVNGGRAAPTTQTTNLASLDAGFPSGTYDLTVAAGAQERWWLALRVQDANNHYQIGPDPGTGTYRLVKVLNGIERQVYAVNTRRHVRAADGDVLRVVNRPDDSIYVYVNGEQVIDAGDIDLLDSTGFGFGSVGAAPHFDDMTVSSVTEAYPISDGFDRAETTDVLGTPEQGTNFPWRVWLGGTWAVRSGQAAPVGGGGVVGVDASTEAAGVRARFTTIGPEQWLVFRYAEDGTYFRYGATSGGRYELQYVEGYTVEAMPTPAQVFVPPVVAAGQIASVTQRLDGSVELSVDGVITHRFTDTTTNRRATIYGLAADGSETRFDDVAISLAPRP